MLVNYSSFAVLARSRRTVADWQRVRESAAFVELKRRIRCIRRVGQNAIVAENSSVLLGLTTE
jgi:hypothetical protein